MLQLFILALKLLSIKKLEQLDSKEVKEFFGIEHVNVFTDSSEMLDFISSQYETNSVLLMMSSGSFDNQDLKQFLDNLGN